MAGDLIWKIDLVVFIVTYTFVSLIFLSLSDVGRFYVIFLA